MVRRSPRYTRSDDSLSPVANAHSLSSRLAARSLAGFVGLPSEEADLSAEDEGLTGASEPDSGTSSATTSQSAIFLNDCATDTVRRVTTSAAPTDASSFEILRQLVLPVYLPVLAVNGGAAMLVPILPLYLRDLGLSFTMVSLIIAAAGIGSMMAQVPFGKLLTTVGETPVMVGSLIVMGLMAGLTGFAGFAVALVGLRFVWGVGSVGWLLSRQTFLTRTVDPRTRGRAMSFFGGTTRLAFLIGPVVSGVLAANYGFATAFAATGIVTVVGLVPLLVWHRRNGVAAGSGTTRRDAPHHSLRPYLPTLAIAGAAQICVMAARQGRFVVLPLLGDKIGLAEDEIGALVAIGGLADLLLFPIAGVLMDRFGRLSAIVPSFSLLGIGLFVLATVQTELGIAAAATVIGIGNGLGSGTMLTIAADLAPTAAPSQFLGALGTVRDAGKIAGPVAVGLLADSTGLSSSAAALGTVSFLGVFLFWFGVGETRDRSPDRPQHPVPTSITTASGA